MSLARRLALLEWARRAGAWSTGRRLRQRVPLRGPPARRPPRDWIRPDQVIYMGTFSKVLFPALRLGYLVVPPSAIDAFVQARALAGCMRRPWNRRCWRTSSPRAISLATSALCARSIRSDRLHWWTRHEPNYTGLLERIAQRRGHAPGWPAGPGDGRSGSHRAPCQARHRNAITQRPRPAGRAAPRHPARLHRLGRGGDLRRVQRLARALQSTPQLWVDPEYHATRIG